MPTWAWITGGTALVLAILLLFLLRPPELAPGDGMCPACRAPLTPVGYGLRGIGAASEPVVERVTVDGCEYDLIRNRQGRLILMGGCVIPPSETGAVCLTCRRSWAADWDAMRMPRNDGFWWRVKGGLMRLL